MKNANPDWKDDKKCQMLQKANFLGLFQQYSNLAESTSSSDHKKTYKCVSFKKVGLF